MKVFDITRNGLVCVLYAAFLSCPAGASIINIFGTGTNSANQAQSAGFVDPHYIFSYGATTGQAVVDGFHYDGSTPGNPGAWVPDLPDAAWISTANSVGNLPQNVPVSFTTQFSLTGFNLQTVAITVNWAVDDQSPSGVLLNGVLVPGSTALFDSSTNTSEPWAHLTTFTINAADANLNADLNTLTFIQGASDSFFNGVFAEVKGTGSLTTVPEPSTVPLMAGGLALAGLARLSRKRR